MWFCKNLGFQGHDQVIPISIGQYLYFFRLRSVPLRLVTLCSFLIFQGVSYFLQETYKDSWELDLYDFINEIWEDFRHYGALGLIFLRTKSIMLYLLLRNFDSLVQQFQSLFLLKNEQGTSNEQYYRLRNLKMVFVT